MFKLILAIAMVVAVTWGAPAPKPVGEPPLAPYPLVYPPPPSPYARAPYPLVYPPTTSPYAKGIYPYYPVVVPVVYYNGKWAHPLYLY